MEENLVFLNDNYSNLSFAYKIDDSKEEMEIEVNCLKAMDASVEKYKENGFLVSYISFDVNPLETYQFLLDNIKNKKILDLNDNHFYNITVYLSNENYQKIISNKQQYEISQEESSFIE